MMTNSNRLVRGLATSNLCPRCNTSSENVLHALRDCPVVRVEWCRVIPKYHWTDFFQSDLFNWLVSNIKKKQLDKHFLN